MRRAMKEYAKSFYNSKAWQKVRSQVWQRDRGLCQECLKNGIIREGDTVHHIKPITPETISDESITLNMDNLETVCRDCHAKVHGKYVQERYKVDELGRIILPSGGGGLF